MGLIWLGVQDAELCKGCDICEWRWGMFVGRVVVPCSDGCWVATFTQWLLLCILLISISFFFLNEVCRPFPSAPLRPRDKKIRTEINWPKYHILNSNDLNKNPWNQCGSFLLKSSNTFTNVTHLSFQHYLSTFHRHRIFSQNGMPRGAARSVGMFQPRWVTDPSQEW